MKTEKCVCAHPSGVSECPVRDGYLLECNQCHRMVRGVDKVDAICMWNAAMIALKRRPKRGNHPH